MAKKVRGGSVRCTLLETNENELANYAIPESQVNVSARHVNLSDVLGVSDWGRKGRAKECSIVMDT